MPEICTFQEEEVEPPQSWQLRLSVPSTHQPIRPHLLWGAFACSLGRGFVGLATTVEAVNANVVVKTGSASVRLRPSFVHRAPYPPPRPLLPLLRPPRLRMRGIGFTNGETSRSRPSCLRARFSDGTAATAVLLSSRLASIDVGIKTAMRSLPHLLNCPSFLRSLDVDIQRGK